MAPLFDRGCSAESRRRSRHAQCSGTFCCRSGFAQRAAACVRAWYLYFPVRATWSDVSVCACPMGARAAVVGVAGCGGGGAEIPNTKYTCNTGRTLNKLLELQTAYRGPLRAAG